MDARVLPEGGVWWRSSVRCAGSAAEGGEAAALPLGRLDADGGAAALEPFGAVASCAAEPCAAPGPLRRLLSAVPFLARLRAGPARWAVVASGGYEGAGSRTLLRQLAAAHGGAPVEESQPTWGFDVRDVRLLAGACGITGGVRLTDLSAWRVVPPLLHHWLLKADAGLVWLVNASSSQDELDTSRRSLYNLLWRQATAGAVARGAPLLVLLNRGASGPRRDEPLGVLEVVAALHLGCDGRSCRVPGGVHLPGRPYGERKLFSSADDDICEQGCAGAWRGGHRPWRVQACCVKTGRGVEEGLQWLLSHRPR